MEATRPRRGRVRKKDSRTPEDQEELRILFETAREEHDAVRARMRSEDFRLDALIAANKEAWNATARSLAPKAPARPMPERPDPVTGKVMFEPELAVAAREAAPKRKRSAPRAAPVSATAIGTAGRPVGRPAKPTPHPQAASATAPGRSDTKGVGAAPSHAAAGKAGERAKTQAPEAPTRAAPGAFEAAMHANMAAMAKLVAEQGSAFDPQAFWRDARKAPIGADAVALAERTMQVPPGTFSIPPLEHPPESAESAAPTRARDAAVASNGTFPADIAINSAGASSGAASTVNTGPKVAGGGRDTSTAAINSVKAPKPSSPIPDWDIRPECGQQALSEIPRETISTQNVPLIVQNPPAKVERPASVGAPAFENGPFVIAEISLFRDDFRGRNRGDIVGE